MIVIAIVAVVVVVAYCDVDNGGGSGCDGDDDDDQHQFAVGQYSLVAVAAVEYDADDCYWVHYSADQHFRSAPP